MSCYLGRFCSYNVEEIAKLYKTVVQHHSGSKYKASDTSPWFQIFDVSVILHILLPW